MTDLGTSQRGDGAALPGNSAPPADAAPGRQRRFRLWPPEISWDARQVTAVAAGLKPAALWRHHRLFVIAACLSVIPRVIAALGFKPALLIQDSFSYMKQSVQLLPLAELRPAGYPLMLHALSRSTACCW